MASYAHCMTPHRNFGVRADGQPVTAYEIKSNTRLRAVVLNHGAILQALYLPDGRNVTLGYDGWDEYAADKTYKGCIIGRNSNRIVGGSFQIAGQAYMLSANDGLNNLHSGPRGLDTQLWEVTQKDTSLELRHTSPDGHDGFPGEVDISLKISLRDMTLRLDMEARTNHPTPINLTWHPYWNLAGRGRIDGHNFQIEADGITGLKKTYTIDIKDTRFDFRRAHPIGNVRLDVNYSNVNSAILTSNGTQLRVTSSLPYMQVYSGDQLTPPRSGIAIEPQYRPNDINLAQDCLLRPGEIYNHWIEYQFSMD